MGKISVCLCLLLALSSHVLAASTEETVKGLLDDLAPALGGVISTGILGPAGNLGGLPHFSLGIGASLYPVDYKDPFDQEDRTIPLGFPSLQGRIGLFRGVKIGGLEGVGSVDLGAKFGYIPSGVADIFKEQPTLTGAELRVGILKDSLASPSLSLSITSNSLSGLNLKDEDWEIDLVSSTFGAKVLVGKALPFIHPYGGLGYEWCSVKADYKIDLIGVEDEWEESHSLFRILAGCEFGAPFIKLGIEYNRLGDASAYAVGLRTGF